MVEVPVLVDNKNKQPRERKVLISVLSFLAVLIVGLVVAIVMVVSTQNAETSESMLETYEEEINYKISGLGQDQIEEVTEIFQQYIDMANPEDKAELYVMRAVWVTQVDRAEKYGEQVISDLIAADEIQQSVNSAVNLINGAYNYNNEELAEEYQDILRERQEAEGVNMDEIMETQG